MKRSARIFATLMVVMCGCAVCHAQVWGKIVRYSVPVVINIAKSTNTPTPIPNPPVPTGGSIVRPTSGLSTLSDSTDKLIQSLKESERRRQELRNFIDYNSLLKPIEVPPLDRKLAIMYQSADTLLSSQLVDSVLLEVRRLDKSRFFARFDSTVVTRMALKRANELPERNYGGWYDRAKVNHLANALNTTFYTISNSPETAFNIVDQQVGDSMHIQCYLNADCQEKKFVHSSDTLALPDSLPAPLYYTYMAFFHVDDEDYGVYIRANCTVSNEPEINNLFDRITYSGACIALYMAEELKRE